jgi:FkbM family methyltransferase
MDRALRRVIGRDGGFFVEAGANDGFEQSNTYWLERFCGWSGVLVEPVPQLYREAARERSRSQVFNCALVSFGDEGPVTMRYGNLMSIISGSRGSDAADHAYLAPARRTGMEPSYEVTVPGRTLTSILDEAQAPEIDLLSLDVEGFEPQALKGLDFERHAPRYLLVEIQDMSAGRDEIESILGDRYVAVEQLSPMDLLFRRADVPESKID